MAHKNNDGHQSFDVPYQELAEAEFQQEDADAAKASATANELDSSAAVASRVAQRIASSSRKAMKQKESKPPPNVVGGLLVYFMIVGVLTHIAVLVGLVLWWVYG
jgi:hypothetical protein